MKNFVFILIFLLIVAPVIIVGQNRSSVVDNSAWFPPVGLQETTCCSHFSLIYYLKSYLWNKHFSRDPRLPENQFSTSFVWNQIADNLGHFSGSEAAFEFMTRQGCSTVQNFPLQIDVEITPSLNAKESGLPYRSTNFDKFWIYSQDSLITSIMLNQLKDSLNLGVCFQLHIPVFSSFYEVRANDPFYRWTPELVEDSAVSSHYVAVVGYDDTKQAFKLINSHGAIYGDSGYFYMGYDWFFGANWWVWSCGFLREDFSHQPKLSLNLNMADMMTGLDIQTMTSIFVDTVYFAPTYGRFDYMTENYMSYARLVTIKKINNQAVPSSITGNGLYNIHNIVLIPLHNHDGNRQLLEDLSDYVPVDEFTSLELLVVDPISATYIAEDNSVIYSYTREAKTKVNETFFKFLGTPKRIIGRVTELPDTTIIAHNFQSIVSILHQMPPDMPLVKESTTLLKRKLITFSIEDTININNPPFFVSIPTDTLKAKVGVAINFQFKAQDPEGDSLKYYLSPIEPGAQLDSLTGVFHYQSADPIVKKMNVIVTDGYYNTSTTFMVKIDKSIGINDSENSPIATLAQNYPNPFYGNSTISFTLIKGGYVSLKVYNLLGKEFNALLSRELYPGTYNVIFNAGDLPIGIYTYRLQVDAYSLTKKMVIIE